MILRPLLLSALVLFAGAVPVAPLAAYAGFDDILQIEPLWTVLPSEPLAAAAGVTYRVRLLAADRAAIDLRNDGTLPVLVALTLAGYQRDAAPVELRAAPGATTTVEVPLLRGDRDCTEGAARFTRLELDGRALAIRPPPGELPPSERAFAVSTFWEAPGFRPDVLAYTAVARDAQTIDLHLLNRSCQAVHAEFAVLGWQPAGTVNPRLHLLPGSTTEILVRGTALDARVTAAALTVWAVRVGEDRGPALGTGPDDRSAMLAVADGFHGAAHPVEGYAGFNPRTLALTYTDRVLEVRNRAAVALQATLVSPDGALPPMTIDLAPGAARNLPLTVANLPGLVASDLRLGGVALPPVVPLAAAAPPANALMVVAAYDDPRFNPLTIACAVARGGTGRAKVTLVNRTAADLHCAWRLPAYQERDANPRLHLKAGAAITLDVGVERADVRLALAQVAVWDVRLGDDEGALLCAAPAAR